MNLHPFARLFASLVFPIVLVTYPAELRATEFGADVPRPVLMAQGNTDGSQNAGEDAAKDENETGAPLPESATEDIHAVLRDLGDLPFPARRMHELLVEAAASGDIEKLREYIGSGDDMTMLSLGGLDGDPIEFLKSQSGDRDGYEILAILLEILQSGFVHLEEGTENEIYVWPYFYGFPLDSLDPAQRVELYTLLTHGDYEDMRSFGAYSFYRVGITPSGRWRFFVAGD